jgi:ketosteroid isomerase-like protein
MTTEAIASPLDRYYKAVGRGDPEEIGQTFAADAVFIPPPRQLSGEGDGTLRALHGRAAIVERFRSNARPAVDHELTAAFFDGVHCLVEGLVHSSDGSIRQPFLGAAVIDHDGLIVRYMVMSAPAGDGVLAALERRPGDAGAD